uniref:C2 domain-containing protein n=1 Tax=Ciona savignyi TaxID=51511 RepID=H2ZAE1_CIOSA
TDRSTLSEKVEDFQIRLKVICARQLTGSNIKPVVKVKAGKNQAKITRIRKGSAPIWNELLMFNFNESLKELYDYVFEFALNNSRKLRSDALIGSFKLDVGTIYDQPGHAFVRKWLLLTDPDDASNSPKGYLKITVCVLGAGDQPPVTGKDDDNDDVEGNLLTPAGASLRAATFTLRVYGAEDLPQMDSGSLKSMKQRIGLGEEGDITKTLVDPFLSFIFAGKKRKTQIIKETNQPEWNEELNLPLKFPSMCDSIKLTIKDWDRIGSDDPIGTVIIPLSRISSTGEEANGAGTSLLHAVDEDDFENLGGFPPTFGPSFVNFYGSPREFSKLGDSLDDLNIGKGIGCAYRGRAMVELVTTMDEEGAEPAPPSQPINDDQIALVKKYMRRRRYRLVVGFESANMIRKPLERIEFEVSIGNYGNKFDTEVGAASSTTEPGNPVFDGVNYHYMAWTSKKPILMVTSQWEDISFRLYAMNLILRTCERMEGQINHLNELVKVEADEIEIASEIVSILDMLILETSKKLPDPRGRTASNQLDRRIHRQRLQTFVAICEEAKDLRQNCTDAQEAISAINDFLERLKLVSYEPQNSLPDVVVWMISDNKRIAYARIPAYEILYSPEKPEFCGRYCAKPCTITLKYPTANAKSKKHYKVPAQLRIIAWLGRAADQDSFEFHSRGQISVYADTFETEMKILVKGWIADGYTDITGEIPLPKSAFSCPPGWVWDGDWKINSELALLYDTSQGHMHVLEDAFEYQYRFPGGTWEPEKITNGKHEEIPNLSSLRIPDGWEWENEWTVDSNRACDEDGWEYSAPDDDTAGEVAWSTIEKTYSTSRRRRLIRNRVCIDQKVSKKAEKTEELIGEGWEYATTMGSQFHIMPKMLDLVRRRRWVRKMITSEASGPAAIFNLDTSIVVRIHFYVNVLSRYIPTPKIYIVYKDVSKLHLRAYIYQGRDLLPMDQDSFSDPVVMVSFLNQTHRTEVQQHTLNPVWDQTLMIDIQFYGDLEHLQRNCPDVLCEVFDKDDLGSLEFMGRTSGKPLLQFDPEEDETPRLQWLNIRKANQAGGNILAAFELILVTVPIVGKHKYPIVFVKTPSFHCTKSDKREMPIPPPLKPDIHVPMVPCGIRPVLQRTAIEFLVWGVRDMQSFQLLSVDSPSVLIQIGEVEIRTKIIKSLKKNPNFAEPIYYLEANLPVDDLYFPPIVIRVKDNRKFGRRPTVGQHIITNSISYRIKPPPEESQSDEGYGSDVTLSGDESEEEEEKEEKSFRIREDEIDWWSKFYASIGESGMAGNYVESGLDLIKVYTNELEKQENFKHFGDFIQTFRLFRGKGVLEDEEPDFAGQFKGTFRIYTLPEDKREPNPPKFFQNVPPTDVVEVKVRIYVIRAFELAPQDSNGLADPYLKIKVGKKRIVDRDNYIPNSLSPTFGRMFELELKLPMEKDLHVEVFDWDLIGTDDKIGETVIDLENRYLSKFKAWCALPETYCISGPCPWRDQMRPKEWLEHKCRQEKWDEPVWNSNTCVMVGGNTYKLDDYEKDKKACEHWGDADERLALYILRTFPHVSEHVETRPLFYDALPNIEQGRLQLWVDMFPKEYGDPGLPYNIEPRKPSKYFLRMIVWNCSEIPMMDVSMLGDKMSDIYFKGWISGLEHKRQKTDVHYRSLDGTGNFNWRFVFPFDYLPQERMVHVSKKEHLWSLDKTVTKFPPVLNIQVWDNDLFGPNEYISEIILPITNMPKCCKFQRFCTLENVPDMQGNCKMEMLNLFDQNTPLKGWWPLYKVVDGVREQAGKLEMSVEIVSEEEEVEKPAGQGRDEPNMNPKLEKPNRPATSFAWFSSPFKSLRYIIWRKYKWIILGVLGVLVLAAFIVLFIYSFPHWFSSKGCMPFI